MNRLSIATLACLALGCGDDGGSAAGTESGATTTEPAQTSGATSDPPSVDSSSKTPPDASTTDAAAESSGGASEGEPPPEPGPIDCRNPGDGISTTTFVNTCNATVSFIRGSDIEGGDLAPGEHACVDIGTAVEPISAIRYWGFIGPDPGGEHHTLAELTLNTDFNDFDSYNISHVDAHNLPMEIVPVGMDDCRTLSCPDSLLPDCPDVGKFYLNDTLVSCVSPDRDNPDSPVAQYFEARCADAYSWSGDDADSVATCTGEDFDIHFCPTGGP